MPDTHKNESDQEQKEQADAFARWETFLTDLELDIASVGMPDEREAPVWVPPTDLGRMPPEFVGRAKSIVAAHEVLMTRLHREQAEVSRHLTALRSVPLPQGKREPIYIDIAS